MDKAASDERSGRRRKKGRIRKSQCCSQYIRGNDNSWENLISKTEKNEGGYVVRKYWNNVDRS